MGFIQKPLLLLIVVILVAGAIFYIEAQKPKLEEAGAERAAELSKEVSETGESAETTEEMDPTKSEVTEPILAQKPPMPDIAPLDVMDLEEKKEMYEIAPDFSGIANWINSEPLSIEDLRGNVVLVDFWTYSCINCIRTLPYITGWHGKYKDQGLVIVGVHTPEFKFEEETENVINAAIEHGIEYPIAQDNDYITWRAYRNRFWPRKYLIDVDGFIRYNHIGEGGYDETEKVIQELLNERAARLGTDLVDGTTLSPEQVIDVEFGQVGTPELYFGWKFARGNFGNPEGFNPGTTVQYKFPETIEPNRHYVEGYWRNNEDNLELAGETGSIRLIYNAKNVNIVAGSEEEAELTLFLDGEKLEHPVLVENQKLYTVVAGEDYGQHELRIDVNTPGFEIFTFTFG